MKISEKDLKEIAYELYKMHWTREHISKEREMATYRLYELESMEMEQEYDEIQTWWNWLEDHGYDGELYACFDEFIDAEYEDADYMSYLLGNSVLWKAYEENMKIK